MNIPLWILGGGGHAKSVIDAARSSGQFDVIGVLDDSFQAGNRLVSGVPVVGPIDEDSVQRFQIRHAVIAIGDNRHRANVAERFANMVSWATVVHKATYIAPNSQLGEGTVICAGAVVQPEATIGAHAIANTSCTIGHDCVVGDFAHIAPGTNLGGGSVIQRGAFVGIGARVIPLRSIGAWSIIGAGSVVIKDIPDGVTAIGIPTHIAKVHAGDGRP